MEGFVKSHRPQSSLLGRRAIAGSFSLLFLLVLFPIRSYSQGSPPPDIPTGFLPGLINYFAGNGPTAGGSYSDGSVPTLVPINPVNAVASDSLGNIYIASNATIYMVYAGGAPPQTLKNVNASPVAGRIYQIAGLPAYVCNGGPDPTCGEGLPLNQAVFTNISALAFDSANNLYICDATSSVVRKVDASSSDVTTIAGQLNVYGGSGDGGPATSANLSVPNSNELHPYGNFNINDLNNYVVRVVYATHASSPPPVLAAEGVTGPAAQPGTINTIAGQITIFCFNAPTQGGPGAPGGCGDYGPATGADSFLFGPNGVAVDSVGNIYIADAYLGGSPVAGYLQVVYAAVLKDGTIPPNQKHALNGAAPTAGYIYAATGYGPSTQFAICAAAPCGDGGFAASAEFGPTSNYLSVILDSQNNVYVADPGDYAIRKIDTSGYVSTVAGIDDPNQIYPANPPPPAEEGGPATTTQLSNNLQSIAFDPSNNLYIADTGDDLVWRAAPCWVQTIDFPAFDPATVTYGVSPITLAATATSGLAVSYAVRSGPGHLSGSELVVTGAGTIVVTASQAGNAEYATAPPVSQSLTVGQAPLTVTANSASKIFGTANPTFTATITGFVNGDTPATPGVYSGMPAFSTTATTTSPYGSYPITVSLGTLASTNYLFANFVPGTLTITGTASQSITFPPLSPVTYGLLTTLPLTATASSGLPVTYQVVSGPGSIPANGTTLTIYGGGTIVVTASQYGNDVYAVAPQVTRSLVANPAKLTVTGPTVTLPFGTSIDPTTFPPATITGFVGADTQASVITGQAKYTTLSGTPNAGAYPISVGLGTLSLVPGATASYALSTLVNGNLIVQPLAQVITFNPVSSSQIYGNNVVLTAAAGSGLPVAFTETGSASFNNGISTTTPPTNNSVQINFTGISTATVTANQVGGMNYAPAQPVTQVFSVGPAPLNITAYPPQVIEQGAPLPVSFPYVIGNPSGGPGGFVNGDKDTPSVITGVPALTTTATQSSPPGVYPVVPTQGTLAAPNYSFNFINGTLTITPPGSFNITASPSSLTIPTGLTGQATLTITPTNAYQGTVTLSCGQLPPNVTCEISPSTYTFPGSQNPNGSENPAQGTITITAGGGTVVGSKTGGNDSISRATILLIPALLIGLLIVVARKRLTKNSSTWGAVALLAHGAGMLLTISCGGSAKSMATTPGTMTVMITGSGTSVSGSGAVTSSAVLTVTIQ